MTGRNIPEVEAVEKTIARLLKSGWEVFPLAARSKVPRPGDRWRSGDYRHFAWRPHLVADGNYAVRPTAEQVILDTDPRDGKRGDLQLAGLELTLGDLPAGPSVETGRRDGGRHRYLTKPLGVPIRRNIAEGVEAISIGGYAVGVGSIHPDTGLAYRWATGGKPPPLPPAWLDYIKRPARPPRTGEGGEITCEHLARCLSGLDPQWFAHNETFHGIGWIDLAMAAHDATDGEGWEEFQAWCEQDEEYGAGAAAQNQARWDSFTAGEPGGLTVKTLFKAVKLAGRGELLGAALDFDGEADALDFNLPSEPLELPDD